MKTNNQEERGPMYFRDDAIGVKQFQEMNDLQRKDYVASLFSIEEDKLDFRDKYILRFYAKVFFPNYGVLENIKTISMDGL